MTGEHDTPQLTLEPIITRLASCQVKPAPFTPGEPLFWDDPHISAQMLAAHLDPGLDLASRRPETIDASVAWIIESLGLNPGDSALDLGCGPGLYAYRLAMQGLQVTGVDLSPSSIAYARDFAREKQLSINYLRQDYRTLAFAAQFDATLLIFGDYCTFSREDRQLILGVVQQALRPGGYFVLDVTTRVHRARHGLQNGWYASEGGFWRPGPHLVLEQGFDYPQEDIYLDQYIVLDTEGKMSVYRNWYQDFNPGTITAELAAGGFEVLGLWEDLTGEPYHDESEWIGLAARRKAP
ncbi:MAG: SAM-dependent methyltransferase [Brevefilum sp.]